MGRDTAIAAREEDRPAFRVPGVAELLGAGVFLSTPLESATDLGGLEVVIVGSPAAAAAAAERLAFCGCAVVAVTAERSFGAAERARVRQRLNVTLLAGMELVCADGIGRLESLVLRKISTGHISAIRADVLFVLPEGSPEVNRGTKR